MLRTLTEENPEWCGLNHALYRNMLFALLTIIISDDEKLHAGENPDCPRRADDNVGLPGEWMEGPGSDIK
jgi:hypothetical protein